MKYLLLLMFCVLGIENTVEHDDMTLSDDEAKLWVSTIALSRGSALINEEMGELPAEREQLYRHILPVMGKPAYPLYFFQEQGPSIIHCNVEQNNQKASLVGIYNFEG